MRHGALRLRGETGGSMGFDGGGGGLSQMSSPLKEN